MSFKPQLLSAVLGLAIAATISLPAQAADKAEINAEVQSALTKFYNEVDGAKELVAKADGVLVFPDVLDAGVGIGGEYGEGALLMKGKTDSYYNLISASYGFKLGAQEKAVILVFNDPGELNELRNSANWEIGADASVAVINVGAEGSINTTTTNKPVVGFVIDQKGLMYDLSLEGSKITKLNKDK